MIVILVAALVAPLVFAQTEPTTMEPVTVTGPIVGSEGGTATSYQPNGTLVVRADNADSSRLDAYGNGLVYDKYGRPVTTPIQPGTRVRVFYTSQSPERIIDHVVVEE